MLQVSDSSVTPVSGCSNRCISMKHLANIFKKPIVCRSFQSQTPSGQFLGMALALQFEFEMQCVLGV